MFAAERLLYGVFMDVSIQIMSYSRIRGAFMNGNRDGARLLGFGKVLLWYDIVLSKS